MNQDPRRPPPTPSPPLATDLQGTRIDVGLANDQRLSLRLPHGHRLGGGTCECTTPTAKLTAGRCKLLRERVFSSMEELLGCLFGEAETQVEDTSVDSTILPVPPHDQSTPIRKPLHVVGVDGCKHGWVAVRLVDGVVEWAGVYPDFAALLASENATVVGVDIPINLPATGARGIDRLVRELLRPRQSTLFSMPPRPVMAASTHAEAVALCRELGLPGISAQGYALREKIFEVERVLRPGRIVVEVHPELCFTVMNGAPLLSSKRSWSGFVERKALLERHGLMLPGALHGLERAAVDDVVDAIAAAWTAQRVALEQARVVRDPEQPESALYA